MYLTAADAIRIWELSHRRPPAEQAVAVLAAVFPEAAREELDQLTLGECNSRLLDLREQVFGSQLGAAAECANCGARFEFNLNTEAFHRAPRAAAADREFELESDQYRVRFRLLNIEDLNFAGASGNVTTARQQLVKRCIVAAYHANRMVSSEELPDSVIADLAARLPECDPEAEALINVSCPSCHFEFQLPFDVTSFFCAEIEAEARRLLREVHVLALNYGWREAEILEMSAVRRQSYLDQLDR
jgi:hypothetical protein